MSSNDERVHFVVNPNEVHQDWSKPLLPLTGLRLIAYEVCNAFGIPLSMLRGRARSTHLTDARKEFCARAHRAGYSTPKIGVYIARDHTTVLYLLGLKGSRTKAQRETFEAIT